MIIICIVLHIPCGEQEVEDLHELDLHKKVRCILGRKFI